MIVHSSEQASRSVFSPDACSNVKHPVNSLINTSAHLLIFLVSHDHLTLSGSLNSSRAFRGTCQSLPEWIGQNKSELFA